MYYLGIDQHKKYSQVAVLDEKGKVQINCQIANDEIAFTLLLKRFNKPFQAVVEAGRNWGMLHDLLEDKLNIDTIVAHPLKTRAIAEAKIKTDSIDAPTLAHLLRADLIPEVYVPPKEVREQKNLLRHRLWLVQLTTMTKNRIHQILERNHVKVPEFSNIFGVAGKKFLQDLSLPNIDAKLLKDHLQILDILIERIKQTETWIKEVLKDNQMIPIIESVPGFGKILSALAALEIDTIDRFPTASKFASYCGLIPSTYASGGKVYHGNLISSSNRWLRYVFVESAWAAIRCSAYCRAYFERIKHRKNSNTAILAVARRLSEIVYQCIKEKRFYEERPYSPCTYA